MTGLLGSVNAGSLLITIVYSALLAWGFFVGLRQIYQGFRAPQELLNPLFANRRRFAEVDPCACLPEDGGAIEVLSDADSGLGVVEGADDAAERGEWRE